MRPSRQNTPFRSHAWLVITLSVALFLPASAFANDWQHHATKLSGLRQKIVAAEGEIKHLIELKRATEDEKQLRQITQQMADKHKELTEVGKEYDEERFHVRFKHPDKDDSGERQYSRFHVKTIKEIEDEMGIDGRLDRVKAQVLATFPVPESERPKKDSDAHSKRHPASHEGDDEESPDRIKLVK